MATPPAAGSRKVLVWDAPTRAFHWLIVVLVAAAYATWWLNWMDWHAWIGEAVLALVLFRLLWGFLGSETARFSRFLASPRAVLRYLTQGLRREPDHQASHNPAGGWMVVLLLALLIVETLSGIYVNNDVANEGPFTELVPAPIANAITAAHAIFWDILAAAVALHVLAIFAYAVVKRQNLVWPMITGWKSLPQNVPQQRMTGPVRAALLFGCGVLVTAAIANFL